MQDDTILTDGKICAGHPGVQEEDETAEGASTGRWTQVHHAGRQPGMLI